MFEGSGETSLFGLGVELGSVGLFGVQHRIDDAGEFVRGGHQRGRAAELASHAAVKLSEFVLGLVQTSGRQPQSSGRAVGAGFGVRGEQLAAAHPVIRAETQPRSEVLAAFERAKIPAQRVWAVVTLMPGMLVKSTPRWRNNSPRTS